MSPGWEGGGGRGTPCNGLYMEARPRRGSFFRIQVYKSVRIPQDEVYERIRKSVS